MTKTQSLAIVPKTIRSVSDIKQIEEIKQDGTALYNVPERFDRMFGRALRKFNLSLSKRKEESPEREDLRVKKLKGASWPFIYAYDELTRAAHEARQLVNVAILLQAKEKFMLSHIPRGIKGWKIKQMERRLELQKHKAGLDSVLKVLETARNHHMKSRERQQKYLETISALQRKGWRIFAVAHPNKQEMPLRTQEPLCVDCGFASIGSSRQGGLSFFRIDSEIPNATVPTEDYNVQVFQLSVESGDGENVQAYLHSGPFDTKLSKSLEVSLKTMLDAEFESSLFEALLNEARSHGEYSSGLLQHRSVTCRFRVLRLQKEELRIAINSDYILCFRMVPANYLVENSIMNKELQAMAVSSALFIAQRFRRKLQSDISSENPGILSDLVDRLRNALLYESFWPTMYTALRNERTKSLILHWSHKSRAKSTICTLIVESDFCVERRHCRKILQIEIKNGQLIAHIFGGSKKGATRLEETEIVLSGFKEAGKLLKTCMGKQEVL